MKLSTFTPYFYAAALGLASLAATVKADETGALYTMDNAVGANHVLVFHRSESGALTSAGSFATGGAGAGTAQGLPSQGSVAVSEDGRWLFVCNAGSDEISAFAVSPRGLQLTDKIASGGQMPISLTFRQNVLYVLNAGGYLGGTDNITGFTFAGGLLTALPGSTRMLSAAFTKPAEVSFNHDGDALVVTEQATSLVDTFDVNNDSLANGGEAFNSAGVQPFGFDFGRKNRLFVSEAAGGVADASSISSYKLSDNDDLTVISGAVPTHQTAACWAIVSRNGRFAYTANAGSGSISGFGIAPDGSLSLVTPGGQTGLTGAGSHPTDMAESDNGRFLYSLNNGNGTISAFRAEANGTLEPLTGASGLPTSTAGLAGF
jgi:6-phosphogluconolactonase